MAIAFTSNPLIIAVLIIFYGIAWATLSTCPYSLFGDMISEKNVGYNMGIFNIAVVLPQIIIGLSLGFIYKFFFMSQAVWVILMSGVSLLIAMGLCLNHYFIAQNKKVYLYQSLNDG